LLGLAIQVRKTNGDESSRLIRVWAVNLVTPFEKAIVWMQHGTGNMCASTFTCAGSVRKIVT
jgi:hypothetical protein